MSETKSLLELPLDIVLQIFRYLNLKDLRNLMLVSKSLNNLVISDNALWKVKCKEHFVVLDHSNDRYVNPIWYHRYRISYNWRKGIFRHQVINSNKVKYMPWLKYFQSQYLFLALGSELWCYGTDQKGIPDCRNKFQWKLDVPIVRRRDIRTNDITRFIVKNDIIVCGNCDGGTAVYQMESIQKQPRCIQHVPNCHKQGSIEVSAVELVGIGMDPGYILTTSHHSQEVKLWQIKHKRKNRIKNNTTSFKEYKLDNAFGGKCLAVDKAEQKVAVGLDGNDRPQVIDIESGNLLVNTEDSANPHEAIRDIHWYNADTICFSTHTGRIQFWDTRLGGVVYKKQDIFQAALYCVRTDGNNAVVSGSAENARCALHDLRSSKDYVQIYFVQSRSPSPVYSLDFDSSKLIAAADRTVAVLCYDVPMPHSAKQIKDYSFDFNVIKSNHQRNFGRLLALE